MPQNVGRRTDQLSGCALLGVVLAFFAGLPAVAQQSSRSLRPADVQHSVYRPLSQRDLDTLFYSEAEFQWHRPGRRLPLSVASSPDSRPATEPARESTTESTPQRPSKSQRRLPTNPFEMEPAKESLADRTQPRSLRQRPSAERRRGVRQVRYEAEALTPSLAWQQSEAPDTPGAPATPVTPPAAPPAAMPIRQLPEETNYDDAPRPIFLEEVPQGHREGCVDGCGAVTPVFESTVDAADALSVFPPYDPPVHGHPAHHAEASRLADPTCHGDCQGHCDVCNPCSPWFKVFRSFCSGPACDEGIGHERVMFAPFDIEVPLPANYVAIRYDSADGLRFPDRAEYFWAKQPAPGPGLAARRVDYQDLKFVMSMGGKRFSTITEIPLRFINVSSGLPAQGNDSTGGLGDISIATKLLLIDGQHWKITQYFKTTLQSGSVARGLSNGNIALEPGLLAQYQWSPSRYWFGELRYWFPTNADPTHGGTLLRYSLGTSKLWYETDTFAALRTLELVGTTVLTGAKTSSDLVGVINVDGEHSLAVLPGLRFVLGPAGDLGLFELGLQAGIATNNKGFYSSLSRLELRFNF